VGLQIQSGSNRIFGFKITEVEREDGSEETFNVSSVSERIENRGFSKISEADLFDLHRGAGKK